MFSRVREILERKSTNKAVLLFGREKSLRTHTVGSLRIILRSQVEVRPWTYLVSSPKISESGFFTFRENHFAQGAHKNVGSTSTLRKLPIEGAQASQPNILSFHAVWRRSGAPASACKCLQRQICSC